MIDQLLFYLEIGYSHILDLNAYDHFLFLISITIPFTLKYFKKLFWIVTLFTIGHTLSIVLSTFGFILFIAFGLYGHFQDCLLYTSDAADE